MIIAAALLLRCMSMHFSVVHLKIVIWPVFVHTCIFRHTVWAQWGVFSRVCVCACMQMQQLTVCVNSVSLSLSATKKSSAFVLKCSKTRAFCSRPSEDKLQWASVNLLSAFIQNKTQCPCMNSANRKNSFIHWLIATLFKNYTVTFNFVFSSWCCDIIFFINYLLIMDRMIRDKNQHTLILFVNF